MKRKKWTEEEEETLIRNYSEFLNSGTLAKLKTRQKKFDPIADRVNSVHHLQDPVNFPFRWSWRDVSIKIQNMRHQYLGVKQKIRVSDDDFNWADGENHWQNFLKYKDVFGDVDLDVVKPGDDKIDAAAGFFAGFDGFSFDCEDDDGDNDDGGGGIGVERDEEFRELEGFRVNKRFKKGGEFEVRREEERRERENQCEERRREREFEAEMEMREMVVRREEGRIEREKRRLERRKEREEMMSELEFENRTRAIREFEFREREERVVLVGGERRMKMEEKREEEEMEWMERMVGMQMENEKRAMQMHVESCHNQMQMLGVLVRVVCQFFGAGNDGLGGGLGALASPILQNLEHHHPGGSLVGDDDDEDRKTTDANSGSHFM